MSPKILAAGLAAVLALSACNDGTSEPKVSASPTVTATTPVVTGSASPTAPSLAATVRRFGKKLSWKGCGGGFECSRMTVPLDYDAPDGETISISVIRLKARRQGSRVGSLVLNPGGPGGSGVEFARQAKQLLPSPVLDVFDTVSFDPRGVGESTPVDCLNDRELDAILAADPTPDTPAEHAALFDLSRDQAEKCQAKSGRLLPHLGTIDAAKDIDVLREALGDKKLTYLGFSYGTLLGTRYAQQFPGNIRAMVLDGAVDPALDGREMAVAQAVGFDRSLDAFFADCERQGCAFASHGDPGATYDRLMADIDKEPLRARNSPGRTLGPSEALFGVAAALYSREFGWPVLRQGLESAVSERDGSALLALFDNLVERDERGRFSNSVEAQAAVNCVDGPYAKDPAAYDSDSKAFAKVAPRFGPALAYGPAVCAYWPVPPTGRPGPVGIKGLPDLVVVGTTRDPATPYEWSASLAKQLSAALVTYDGDGHTAYGYGRNACVDRVVNAYLISLTRPTRGTRCR